MTRNLGLSHLVGRTITLLRDRNMMADGWLSEPDQSKWVARVVPAGTRVKLVAQYDGGANTAYNHPFRGEVLDGDNVEVLYGLTRGLDFEVA